MHSRVEQRPIIHLLLAVRPFAACTVKPLLKHMAIAAKSMLQCLYEHIVIFVCSVMWVVPVPWRYVDAEFKIIFTAGLRQLLQDVTLSILPWTLGHGVAADRVRPKAETVMMLGCDDDSLHAGSFGYRCPLAAIKSGRIEDLGFFLAGAPFRTCKGVRSEVHEHRVFILLPFDLRLGRHDSERSRLMCCA